MRRPSFVTCGLFLCFHRIQRRATSYRTDSAVVTAAMAHPRRKLDGEMGGQAPTEDLSGGNLVNIWQKYARLEHTARVLQEDNEQLLDEKTRALQVWLQSILSARVSVLLYTCLPCSSCHGKILLLRENSHRWCHCLGQRVFMYKILSVQDFPFSTVSQPHGSHRRPSPPTH